MIEFTNDCIELTTHGLLKYILKLTDMLTKADKRGDIWKRLSEKRGSKIVQLEADLNEADEMHTRAMESVKLLETEVERLKKQIYVGQRIETEKSVKIAQLEARVEELKTSNVGAHREQKIQSIRANRLQRQLEWNNDQLQSMIDENDSHLPGWDDDVDGPPSLDD